ncbi:unnamed protein product [Miscanthus lutarioriparius]|uniref:Uncharacterized protein n=1 Tax=Miscanthus lutarioriparius TaxID=422564 RepID=A0A811N0W4_9POAL|nr:unnamed protein product [Miscanthus lutarioriparius]
METEMQAALMKAAMFVLVQALVYLILSQSSAVFSRTKSLGLRPARSLSLSARRMLELLSDLPIAGEPSPVAAIGRTRSASSPRLPADRKQEDRGRSVARASPRPGGTL